MEITIRPEKFLNADAPEITEEMLDWLFLTMWSTRFENYVKKVDTIDIMANTAYNGCRSVHFYITINGVHNFHKEWYTGIPTSCQEPPLGYYFQGVHEDELNWLGDKKERSEWMVYFVSRDVDMGPEGLEAVRVLDEQIAEHNRREEIKKEAERKEARYQQYLNLKKEFGDA